MATAVPPRGIAAALGGAVDMAIGRKAEVFSGRMRGERGEGGNERAYERTGGVADRQWTTDTRERRRGTMGDE